jgi:hypothetical protein
VLCRYRHKGHFTGARDGSFLAVTDYAGALEAKFLTLPKFNRLHNAESLALFFLECIYGTYTVVNLPRLSLHHSHFDTFPKVSYDGSILASLADVLGRKGIGMETTL